MPRRLQAKDSIVGTGLRLNLFLWPRRLGTKGVRFSYLRSDGLSTLFAVTDLFSVGPLAKSYGISDCKEAAQRASRQSEAKM